MGIETENITGKQQNYAPYLVKAYDGAGEIVFCEVQWTFASTIALQNVLRSEVFEQIAHTISVFNVSLVR